MRSKRAKGDLFRIAAYNDVVNVVPTPGLIPYAPNSPLWSDDALKSRWIVLPNDGPPYSPDEQINFVPTGEWRVV